MKLPRRLYVVAAHADDDTIGCGGTMAAVASAGGEVRVAYLTDGSRSHPGSRRFPAATIAAIREREAVTALAELGIASVPAFFRLRDSALATLDEAAFHCAVMRLAGALAAFAPDLVLAPWERDPHPDHIAAARIASRAMDVARLRAGFAGYDVWLSIRGEREDYPQEAEASLSVVALDAKARAAKRRALFAHRSQVGDLIGDDPDGFRITAELAERWLGPVERFWFQPAGRMTVC